MCAYAVQEGTAAWCSDVLKLVLECVQAALRTMTVDDYFAKNPGAKEKIDDEIRNNLWGY